MSTLFQDFLDNLHKELLDNRDGKVADYIPELANVDVDNFGIAIATVDGLVYQVGDSQTPFSIQSISKAFTYGIALQDKGVAHVFRKVDVEPSGEAFNSISLEPETGRPLNPMINAGAIATTGLVRGDNGADKLARIVEILSLYVGHDLEVDEKIYLSEKTTGHRNRAISHLLRNYEILEDDPEEALDAYFQQCSILVTCRDLALMGACLANNGVNPISGMRVLPNEYVSNVLSVMASCGMYDYSGNWIYNVGMPAKSGVGGGIVAVLPGQFGLAIYSPRLDVKGNSVRGIAVCERFSSQFGLHMMNTARVTSSTVIRTTYLGSDVRSKRERHPFESNWLDSNANKILIFELMGELTFVSTELILREVSLKIEQCTYLVLDFSRVTSIDMSASFLLTDLVQRYKSKQREVLFVRIENMYGFSRYIKHHIVNSEDRPVTHLLGLDQALEWCEDRLLAESGIALGQDKSLAFSEQPLCDGMNKDEMNFLESLTCEMCFSQNESICHEGDPADYVYFLVSGKVSAWLKINHNKKIRLGGSSTGWVFGESELLGNKVRSADVSADTNVVIRELKTEELLSSVHPLARGVENKLFRNLCLLYDQRLRRSTAQIRTLSF